MFAQYYLPSVLTSPIKIYTKLPVQIKLSLRDTGPEFFNFLIFIINAKFYDFNNAYSKFLKYKSYKISI